jgi:hypothetical protein
MWVLGMPNWMISLTTRCFSVTVFSEAFAGMVNIPTWHMSAAASLQPELQFI